MMLNSEPSRLNRSKVWTGSIQVLITERDDTKQQGGQNVRTMVPYWPQVSVPLTCCHCCYHGTKCCVYNGYYNQRSSVFDTGWNENEYFYNLDGCKANWSAFNM